MVCIFTCAFRYFCRFSTLHFCNLEMNMLHDQHIHFKWHVFTISLYFALPKASLCVYPVWVHSHLVWRFSIKSSSMLCLGNLALNGQRSFMHVLDVADGAGTYIGVCLSVHLYVNQHFQMTECCLYISHYIHTCVSTFIHLYFVLLLTFLHVRLLKDSNWLGILVYHCCSLHYSGIFHLLCIFYIWNNVFVYFASGVAPLWLMIPLSQGVSSVPLLQDSVLTIGVSMWMFFL